MRKILLYTLHVTLYTLFLCGCAPGPVYKETRFMMGTTVEITINAAEKKAEAAAEKAFLRIQDIENKLSVFKPDSEISALNRTGRISPSPELMEVMRESARAGDATEGAFDVTVAPVLSLWGFGPLNAGQRSKVKGQSDKIPEEKDIKKEMELVDYKNIVIDEQNNTVYFKKKGMQVNLGGIAKGYAADKAIESLKKDGIKQAIVNAGGNMCAMGKTWRVGIKDPRKPGVFKVLKIRNKAVSTSGDYERYFTALKEGKKQRFSHILDPKTGYPAEGCVSVTVTAPSGIMSDWLSTAVFVLGPEKGVSLLKKLRLKGVIVTPDGKILTIN